jgi:rRNA-processing protein FCF1
MPFQFKLNLDSELLRLLGEFEIIIPSCVLNEVHTLSHHEKFGSEALKLARSKPSPPWYKILEANLLEANHGEKKNNNKLTVDAELILIAKKLNGIVVTNDKVLLKKLHDMGVRTISMRAKKYLKLNFQL